MPRSKAEMDRLKKKNKALALKSSIKARESIGGDVSKSKKTLSSLESETKAKQTNTQPKATTREEFANDLFRRQRELAAKQAAQQQADPQETPASFPSQPPTSDGATRFALNQPELSSQQPTPPITLTTEQVERIKSGELQAPESVINAVMAGQIQIEDPGIQDIVKRFATENVFPALGALPSMRVAGTAKRIIGAARLTSNIGKPQVIQTTFRGPVTVANEKTMRLSKEMIEGYAKESGFIGAKAVAISGTLVAALGTYPWAEHLEGDNVLGSYSIMQRDAIQAGLYDLADEVQQEMDDVMDPNIWQKIIDNIPFANVLSAVKKIYESAKLSNEVNKQIIANKRQQAENNEDGEQYWSRIKQQEADADKEAVDYYNQERKKMVEWEREIEEQTRAEVSAERKKKLQEEAAFWRKEREATMEAERKEREAIADFWIQYKRRSQQISDDNRPSNLNFGLI